MLSEWLCKGCGKVYHLDIGMSQRNDRFQDPRCEDCGSLLWYQGLVINDWALRLEQLKLQHMALVGKVQPIEAKIKPLREQMKQIEAQIIPLNEQASPFYEKLRKLDWEIQIAEAWAKIEKLKKGSKVWILHVPYIVTAEDRGLYDTISEEQAQKRFLSRAKEKGKTKGSVPHELIIQRKEGELSRQIFIARDNKGRQYTGFIKLTKEMPKLLWRRGMI